MRKWHGWLFWEWNIDKLKNLHSQISVHRRLQSSFLLKGKKTTPSKIFNSSRSHWFEFKLIYLFPISSESKWSAPNFCQKFCSYTSSSKIPTNENICSTAQVWSQSNHTLIRFTAVCKDFFQTSAYVRRQRQFFWGGGEWDGRVAEGVCSRWGLEKDCTGKSLS